MTVYARPGAAEALMSYESRYGNFIGGEWFAPVGGEYFENSTPVTGQPFCEVARSNEADVDKALDAAHGAASQWASTAPAERANILNKIVVPRLPRTRGVRRLQAVRHRPREPQDDARPLPADQEPTGVL